MTNKLMLAQNKNIFQNDVSSKELEIAKFRNYGREKYGNAIKRSVSFDEFSEHLLQHTSINLPPEIEEYFIRIDTAHYFGAVETPFLKNIELILSQNRSDNNFIANHREVKEFYHKWIYNKNDKEKTYFALTLINMVERNFNYQSFYNLVLYAVILTYEKSLFNPQKAADLYTRSQELVKGLTTNLKEKNKILYFINLFKGFTHLKEYDYANAKNSFSEALKYNPHGISAEYYKGLSSVHLNDFDSAFDSQSKIIQFDKMRFQFAINYNQLKLFEFFFNGAVVYNIFAEDGFAPIVQDFDFLIRAQYSGEPNSMELTYAKLINLKNLRNKEFYTDKIIDEIDFLKTFLENYKQKQNGLVRLAEQILRNKLVTLIEYLRNLVEGFYYDEVKDEFLVFDSQIEQNKRQLKRIQHEGEDAHKRAISMRDDSLEESKSLFENKKEALFKRIERLEKDEKYNPMQMFFSSMIFTVGIALTIFMLAGLSSTFVSSDYDVDGSSLSIFVSGGIIWGGITFVIGIGISIVTAFSANREKYEINKKLVKETEKLEKQKQDFDNNVTDDASRRENAYANKFNDRLKNQEKIIKSFLNEREHNYQNKLDLARKEIEVYTIPLNKILESFQKDG
ncbi:MAG: hypothetical protein GY936_19895 [Ignavibacteriae bacterium]|nr:hypothetical protein [Ignavibacteriota bacterium]